MKIFTNCLKNKFLHIVRSASGAMFSDEKPMNPSRLDWFIADFDSFVDQTGIKTQTALYLSYFILEYSPLFLMNKATVFTNLPRNEQVTNLERLEVSQLSIFFTAIKAVSAFIYFEHPDVLFEANIDPTLVWPNVVEEMRGRFSEFQSKYIESLATDNKAS